jgi:hypothetical protein
VAGDQRRQGELTERVELREVDGGAGSACAEILRLLPDWFGIPIPAWSRSSTTAS